MSLLSEEEKYELMKRRGFKSAKTGKKHKPSELEVHHMNRNTRDNRPQNLKLLTKREHKELHKRRK
jgi:hypothetical protein